MGKIPSVSLNGGIKMPMIGMGTATYPPADSETVKTAVIEAIKSGYRHFDTSHSYGSEEGVGKAISEALKIGLIKSRDELFITSKLWCNSADRNLVVPAIKASLRTLELEYLDLYLIHVPLKISDGVDQIPIPKEFISEMDIKSVWEGMEECKNLGLTRAIGVSNFSCNRLQQLLEIAKIPPAVNQVEVSPVWQQKKLIEYCKEKGIHVTGYSPLGSAGTIWGHNEVIGCDVLLEIAKIRGKSTAQIALKWVYEQGVTVLVKSFNKERMKQNIEIFYFDWCLSSDHVHQNQKILQLPQRKAILFASVFGQHHVVQKLDSEL